MIESGLAFSSGLSLRPAAASDQIFLRNLYRDARPDLQLIDGDADSREQIIAQQYETLAEGAGENYPNAMHFVIEKAATNIGNIIVDFGHNEVRIIYLAFVPSARGLGYGKEILRGMQLAAERVRCPLAVVVWRSNFHAKKIYLELGFRVEESQLAAERLVWYPGDSTANSKQARFS